MTTARPLSILLVDDHRDGADTLDMLLRLRGYETRVVYSASVALAAAAERMPDVVISDIGLPQFDGCELAQRIAALDGTTPLMIAVTGYAELRDRCRLAGFDHFFLKPATPTEIVSVLEMHAEKLGPLLGQDSGRAITGRPEAEAFKGMIREMRTAGGAMTHASDVG